MNSCFNPSTGLQFPVCDGKRHGFGTRVWSDGTRYEGQWKEDEMCGTGIFTLIDGTSYEGEFRHNLKYVPCLLFSSLFFFSG